MRIYLTDQKNKFRPHLDFLKSKKVMDYDKSRLTEKITTIDIDTNKKIDQLNLDFLFDYKIFLDNIMTFKTQWTDDKRKMKVGDTIAQQVYIPPTKTFSFKKANQSLPTNSLSANKKSIQSFPTAKHITNTLI